jgi:hypothetical protein
MGGTVEERITTILHRGKEILSVDYSDLGAKEVVELTHQLPAALEMITEVRILVDGTNSQGSLESMAAFKDLFEELGQSDVPKSSMKAAGLGASGLGKILFDGLVRLSPIPIRLFATKEEALNWLAE